MKASWREKNSLQLYSTVEIHTHTHTHIHMNISLSRYVSRLKCKKGPHWELNPGPLAIKARLSQSENHTTRPYGRDESQASIRATRRISYDEHGKTFTSSLKCKKGPHWELNPGPLAIKARFSQSENHTTRPYGRDESLASIRTTSRISYDEHDKTFTSSLKTKRAALGIEPRTSRN